jgi:uncharacterized protein YcbK (DUF882 family)
VRLTPHFSLGEWVRAGDPEPPAATVRHLRALCAAYLEPLRREWGPVTIHSGIRSPERNRAVGGAPQSYHVPILGRRGAAADISCARGTPREWYRTLDQLGAPGLGLYPTHVHVDNRASRARW